MSTYPLSMEEVKHYYGYILYRHKLKTDINNAVLITDGVRDSGYIMVDQGQAFVNDFNLGRYWPQRGPQVTLENGAVFQNQ
nr:hypothetical protein BaRGS_027559 [Batillaria attramentaria]